MRTLLGHRSPTAAPVEEFTFGVSSECGFYTPPVICLSQSIHRVLKQHTCQECVVLREEEGGHTSIIPRAMSRAREMRGAPWSLPPGETACRQVSERSRCT